MSKLNTKRTKSSLCHTSLHNTPADRKCVLAITAGDVREETFTVGGAHGTDTRSPLQGGESLWESSSPTLVKGSGVLRTAEPQDTCHAFNISYSSTFPSGRGRLPGAADLEAKGGLGAFSSGCNHDSSRPWRLLSVPLRCSEGRGPRHSEPHMVANRWSFLKAGLDVSVRDRGLVWDLCPV